MTEKSSLLIHKIEITNCGGFCGHHEVELSTKKEQNFTIILGASGIGKSTTFQLIFWCLFGEHFNPKKPVNMTDEGIVNSSVIKELEVGKNVVASVVLHIHDQNGEKYRLTRSLKATKHRDETGKKEDELNNSKINSGIQMETDCKMVMPDKDGGMVTEQSESIINDELRPLLPQSLSDFFLFDGERLLEFANPTGAAEIIKDGIEKISGLPIVASMVKSMAITSKGITRAAGSKDVDSQGITNALDQFEEERKELDDEVNVLKEEQQGNEILHNKLREQMIRSKSGKDVQTKIDKEEKALSRLKKDKKNHDNTVKYFLFEKIPQLLIRETLLGAQNSFARLEELDEIPPSITSDGIDKIRKKLKCLCGTEFKENDETWEKLGKVKDRIVDSNMVRDVMQGRGLISGIVDDSVPDRVKVNYDKLNDVSVELRREIKQQIADVNKLHDERSKLPRAGGINYDEVSKQSDDLWKANGILQGKINDKTGELEDKDDEIIDLGKKLKVRLELEGKNKIELAKIAILKAITSFAKKRENEIKDDLRAITEKATDEYFMKSAPQKEEFDHVEISSNYDIVACNKDGDSKSLSAGQSHVLGLSYVAGCRQITNTNTFLFIDSPLHNISGDFRNEVALVLAKHLPSGVQVVLFVTESEYKHGDEEGAKPVREILKPTGKIWREYEIVKMDDGTDCRTFKELK